MNDRSLILGVVVLLTSCVPEKGSEDFLPPNIKAAEALVDGTSVSLSCKLSDNFSARLCKCR